VNVLTAQMLEPVMDEDGAVSVIALNGGMTSVYKDAEIFSEKEFGKEERVLLRNIVSNRMWPLPKEFTSGEVVGFPRNGDEAIELHSRICRYLKNYVWFSDARSYELVANWVISTYFREDFQFAPLLIFDGVTKSGKSTVLKALRLITYRGAMSSSYSAASIARQIESYDTTMLLDESLDTLQTDRGLEVCALMKAAFEKGSVWIRADPKSKRLNMYHVYTSMAVAVKGEGLPEDIYNRGIRIGMVGMPDNVELMDIDSVDEDDASGDCSPSQIRAELYKFKWAMLKEDIVGVGRTPEWSELRGKAKWHFTTRIDKGEHEGEWYYGFINGIPRGKAPRISGRTRNIASTLYSIGLLTASEHPTIEMIIESEDLNRQVIVDTPEALAFSAFLDLIFAKYEALEGLDRIEKVIDAERFDRLVKEISTTDIAQRYNEILTDQGNAERDPAMTKTVTSKILALGFAYRRGSQNRSYMRPEDPAFKPQFLRCVQTYFPEYSEMFRFDPPKELRKTWKG